jgi:hypothetical protein
VTCHNSRTRTAGLALDTLDVTRVAADAETWEKVVRKIRGRMMPPPGLPRPDDATYDALSAHLEEALDRAVAARPNPGRTDTFRRLSRVEYQNAIRDILALDVDVSALLPKDDASHGFDNVSNGELSPTLLERYLAAAQKVSRGCDRKCAAVAGESPRRVTGGSHAGGSPRGIAVRDPRRRDRALHVPAAWGLRNSSASGSRPQRERRRPQ